MRKKEESHEKFPAVLQKNNWNDDANSSKWICFNNPEMNVSSDNLPIITNRLLFVLDWDLMLQIQSLILAYHRYISAENDAWGDL